MTSLDPRTQRVIRDLAKAQHDLKRQVARLNRGQDAGRTTIHHGALQVADSDGKVTHRLGETGLAPVAGPVPARPAAPALTAGQAQIIVATDGEDEHGESAPEDWAKTRIYATTQPPLAATPAHVKGSITEVDGETTIGVHAGLWHVGIVWVTESGQESELSETVEVEVEPPVDTDDLAETLATAEQIIADAVAAAQVELDELRDRLDNFEEYDPSDLIAQINQVAEDLVVARQEAAGLVSDLADRVDDIKIPDVSGFITQAEVDAAAAAAETAAKEHADLVAQGAKDDAIAEAEAKANAAQAAAEQAAKAYADQQDVIIKGEAAADAQAKADAAQAEAERLAAEHAELVATGAKDDAIAEAERLHALAIAEAEAAKTRADEAHTEAGEAWDHADTALTRAVNAETNAKQHANNLPKMLGGSTAPTGTAPDGSVWFQRDASNTVIGRWERINGSWVQQEVSGELIDNLEAGKITALHTEFAESVIGKLWTQLAVVDRLIATSAWIGGAMIGEDAVEAKHIVASETLSGKVAEFLKLSVADLVATGAQVDDAVIQKLWVDGLVGLSATLTRAVIAAPNLWPDPGFTQDVYGSWTRVDGGIERNGSESLSVSYVDGDAYHIPIEYGVPYRISVDLTLDGPGRGELWVRDSDENKHYIGSTARASNLQESGTLVYEYQPSSNSNGQTRHLYLGFGTRSTPSATRLRFENLRVERMTDGRLIVDDSIYTRHLHVTQEMVGEFASFMHLVVDQMNVNALWADQSWQNAGHFGSETLDTRTRIDNQGMLTTHRNEDGEHVPAIQLGGADLGLNFYDPATGDPTGSITRDGRISGREINSPSIKVSGRPIVGDTEQYPGQTPIIDTLPRGVIAYGERNMSNVSTGHNVYGFLEVSAPVEAGRVYTVETNQIRVTNDRYVEGQFRYTLGANPGTPTTRSPSLHVWVLKNSGPTAQPTTPGHYTFIPEQTGILRVLLSVSITSSGTGITFPGNMHPQLVIRDEGIAKTWTSQFREAGHNGTIPEDPDNQNMPREYHTGWTGTWVQAYHADNTRYTGTSRSILQGLGGDVVWHTHTGGYRSTTGFGGPSSEAGRTIPQALAGSTITDGTLTITGVANPTASQGIARIYLNDLTAAPTTSPGKPSESLLIAEVEVSAGTETVIDLPQWVLDRIKAGTFGGFTYHPGPDPEPYITIARSAPIRLRYQR